MSSATTIGLTEPQSPHPRPDGARDCLPSATDLPMRPSNILIIEDGEALTAIAGEVLRSCGHRVFLASSVSEATKFARAAQPPIDLLITEVHRRGVMDPVVSQTPHMRVLYISTHNELSALQDRPEPFHFLKKPFTPVTLARKVRELLASLA
ncbi:MAG TPA: hypothetical protein VMP01_06225 [Pirellulaceae bacterium]|nr:hypothetical protein [Pirellulaceae bacterium]